MELCVEDYLAVNFLVTAALYTLAARQAGSVRGRAVLAASLVSALGALAVQAGVLPAGFMPPLALLCAAASLGRRSPGARARALGWCAAWICAFAGAMELASRFLPLKTVWRAPLFAAPLFVFGLLLTARRPDSIPRHVRLRIGTRMGQADVTALIDTGNQLREPLSGLPVLIVSAACLKRILDPVCLDEAALLPPGFRLVRYHALSGEGRLRCFRPASICRLQRGRWVPAPDMWVAVYAGRIPGALDALAPEAVRNG